MLVSQMDLAETILRHAGRLQKHLVQRSVPNLRHRL